MTPYTLPEPHITEWSKRGWANNFYAKYPPHDADITISLFTTEMMDAAYQAGAASRDAEIEALRIRLIENNKRRKATVIKNIELTNEVEALRADAESWRKYKARKDAVIAAGMGRNPLRESSAMPWGMKPMCGGPAVCAVCAAIAAEATK